LDFNTIDLETSEILKLITENLGIFGKFDDMTNKRILYFNKKINTLKKAQIPETNNNTSSTNHSAPSNTTSQNTQNTNNNDGNFGLLEEGKGNVTGSPLPMNKNKVYKNINNNNYSLSQSNNNIQIDLNSQIVSLKNELNYKNQIINNLKNELNELKISHNNKLSLINQMQNNLNQKEQELSQLKNKLESDSNLIKSDSENKYGFAITFRSIDQDIMYPMICNKKESISRLEEELYNEYPKYKEFNTYLTCNGVVLKRFKTVGENNIKKSDAIIVNIME